VVRNFLSPGLRYQPSSIGLSCVQPLSQLLVSHPTGLLQGFYHLAGVAIVASRSNSRSQRQGARQQQEKHFEIFLQLRPLFWIMMARI
jgi:hypothetical protein